MGKSGKLAIAAIITILTALYLSGYIFLLSNHQPANRATPLTILQYAYYYGDNPAYRPSLIKSELAGIMLIAASLGLIVFKRDQKALHGDAKFATTAEIKGLGLLGGEGILLGKLGNKYLTLPGQQGLILTAPPRAGKGVGVVVPNLLNFPGSVIVVDIKKENWQITSGFRKQHGQQVYLFDPLSETGETARWNPLSYVSEDPNIRISDIQRIAEMLYTVPAGKDKFWAENARKLFLGITLYLFETLDTPRTIGEVLRQAMTGGTSDDGFVKHWKKVIADRRASETPLSAICAGSISEIIDLAPQTSSGIRSEFTASLNLWLNPLVDSATSENDFDLRDLRKKPISIYVGVTPDNLDRVRPILSLFFQQAIGLQTRELPEHNKSLKYQLMLMLDEFTALGRIPIIETACGFLPGYNVRTVLVIQTPSQMRSVYGRDGADTIIKTLAARIMYAPKDYMDAQEISNELGSTTVKGKSQSKPTIGFARTGNTTESDQRRMLLLPQEVKELGSDKEIIIYEGIRPILADKIIYYRDRNFKKRLLPPPKVTKIGKNNSIGLASNAIAQTTASPSYRPMTNEDIKSIASIPLAEFKFDLFSLIPKGKATLDKEDIKDVARAFVNHHIA